METVVKNVGAILMGSLVVVGMFAAFMYATSPEVWYAGQHTAGCDGSQECGCYKKLLELDRINAETNTRSSKR